jgi:hypothetical protein
VGLADIIMWPAWRAIFMKRSWISWSLTIGSAMVLLCNFVCYNLTRLRAVVGSQYKGKLLDDLIYMKYFLLLCTKLTKNVFTKKPNSTYVRY